MWNRQWNCIVGLWQALCCLLVICHTPPFLDLHSEYQQQWRAGVGCLSHLRYYHNMIFKMLFWTSAGLKLHPGNSCFEILPIILFSAFPGLLRPGLHLDKPSWLSQLLLRILCSSMPHKYSYFSKTIFSCSPHLLAVFPLVTLKCLYFSVVPLLAASAFLVQLLFTTLSYGIPLASSQVLGCLFYFSWVWVNYRKDV